MSPAMVLVASLLLVVCVPLVLRVRGGRHPRARERVLIVGGSSLARKLVEEIVAQTSLLYSIIGVVDDTVSDDLARRYPHLGPLEHLDEIIKEFHPDRIVVALAERRRRLPISQLLSARVYDGITVEDGVEAYGRLTGKLAIEALTPSSIIFDKDFQKSPFVLAMRRTVSLAVSVVGLLAFAPLFALIALAIKLDSRGPVFFVHERVGLGGKPFMLIKFRTMHPADGETPMWFQENHNRVTRVGRWLRKVRLDELPQFLNVFRGDMDLVGPRPQRVSKFEFLNLVARNIPESGAAIPYFPLRSRIRPGMTGWAQVRYHYAHTLEEEIEKLRYDLYYIKKMSIWFDLSILIETLKMISLGRKSSEAAQSQMARRAGGVDAARAGSLRSSTAPESLPGR